MPESAAQRLRRLLAGDRLTRAESAAFIGELMDGSLDEISAAAALAILSMRGESVDEIVGAAEAMRSRMLPFTAASRQVLDIVGTGGDGANTINLSTMAALVVAASGVPVAKHGNRAASSSCGSADVLEACGYRLDATPQRAAAMLDELGFTFLFAPRYHPAMRNAANVRRTLGVRTIFNVLGPLCNPAHASLILVGVARPESIESIGAVLRQLGVEAGAVMCSEGGIDEAIGDGVAQLYRFNAEGAWLESVDPHDFGIDVPLEALVERSVEGAARAFREVLGGVTCGRSEVVALNAALAFVIAGVEGEVASALARARAILASGSALDLFERAAAFSNG
ncbi:MAG TPA: anthranilate phosphoribosyltransferase [Candidatus Dormibacteraeota bacterium]|nr:anthranilate phosphoribosyltransferase [Candidatus Dormibacteraeota bacterium]